MCLRVSYKKKYEEEKCFFASFKSLKKGVGSGVGSGYGSISQRYRSAPKCHPDPQHGFLDKEKMPVLDRPLGYALHSLSQPRVFMRIKVRLI
jgi:hypothetical protein